MDKLDHRQLTLIKRAAEDAIHACNRHYGPFVDVVAHPLNIIALVEMAQSRQAELDQAYEDIETFVQAHQRECDIKVQIANELKEKDKRIEKLLLNMTDISKGIDQLLEDKNMDIVKAKKALTMLSKALGGEHE